MTKIVGSRTLFFFRSGADQCLSKGSTGLTSSDSRTGTHEGHFQTVGRGGILTRDSFLEPRFCSVALINRPIDRGLWL